MPADFGARDDLQRTVLMHACASGSLDLINVLILNRSGDNRAFSFCYMQLNDYDVFGPLSLFFRVNTRMQFKCVSVPKRMPRFWQPDV